MTSSTTTTTTPVSTTTTSSTTTTTPIITSSSSSGSSSGLSSTTTTATTTSVASSALSGAAPYIIPQIPHPSAPPQSSLPANFPPAPPTPTRIPPHPSKGTLAFGSQPSKNAKTNGSNGTSGSASKEDIKYRTYEIIVKRNPKTGKNEYSMVWAEVTERDNPKRILGCLGIEPSDDPTKPSKTASAIATLVQAAEARDPNFSKSQAQTTLKLDGKPATKKQDAYDVAVLTRGGHTVTLDPTHKGKDKGAISDAIEALNDAFAHAHIIDQTGADFKPRDKAANAGNTQKKAPRDITQEPITDTDLNTYLDRVGSSKIRVLPAMPLANLNRKPNLEAIKAVTDKPVFIPVDTGHGVYVYLYKIGKELYYYDPTQADIQSQQDNNNLNYLRNSICRDDSSPIGQALYAFAYEHRIQNLHAAKTTCTDFSTQAMGVQWLTHLSSQSDVTPQNAFLGDVDEITVPAPPVSGGRLSSREQQERQDKLAAETKGKKGAKAAHNPAASHVAQPLHSCHEIFDGMRLPTDDPKVEGNELTPALRDAWLNALKTRVSGCQGVDEMEKLKAFCATVIDTQHGSQYLGASLLGQKPKIKHTWNATQQANIHLTPLLTALYPHANGFNITAQDREFNAQALMRLAQDKDLRAQFCGHKGNKWSSIPSAAIPELESDPEYSDSGSESDDDDSLYV